MLIVLLPGPNGRSWVLKCGRQHRFWRSAVIVHSDDDGDRLSSGRARNRVVDQHRARPSHLGLEVHVVLASYGVMLATSASQSATTSMS